MPSLGRIFACIYMIFLLGLFILYQNISSPLLNICILKYRNENFSGIFFSAKEVP